MATNRVNGFNGVQNSPQTKFTIILRITLNCKHSPVQCVGSKAKPQNRKHIKVHNICNNSQTLRNPTRRLGIAKNNNGNQINDNTTDLGCDVIAQIQNLDYNCRTIQGLRFAATQKTSLIQSWLNLY